MAFLGVRLAHVATLAAAVAIAVVTWQTSSLAATWGVDASWMTALDLAHVQGIHFGPDFAWTYGPLGYLAFPIATTTTTLIQSFGFTVVSQVAFCYVALRFMARFLPVPIALLGAYALAALPLSRADVLFVMLFLYCALVLDRPESDAARWFPLWGGCLAGAALLMKTNTGAAGVVLVAVTAWGAYGLRHRRTWLAVVVMLLSVAGFWVISGNRMTDLPGWLRLSFALATGYAGAMQRSGATWQIGVAVLASAAYAGVLVSRSAQYSLRRRLAVLLISALFVFTFFKEAFVRQDFAHAPYFFTAVAVALVAFPWAGGARVVAVLGIGVCLIAARSSHALPLQPAGSSRHFIDQMKVAISSDRVAQEVASSWISLETVYGVSPRLLSLLRGRTVDVEPTETAVVNAYGLTWRPLAVAQVYAAYTATLDDRNAAILASSHAPDRILLQSPSYELNGRALPLEAPATFRAFLCNYRQVALGGSWVVLAHAGPRCGHPVFLESAATKSGTPIAVPAAPAGDLVYARISLRDPLWNEALGLVYKPRIPFISFDGGPYVSLVGATADDGIVLRVPRTAGFGAQVVGALSPRTLAVRTVSGAVRVDFYAAPIE